MRADLPEGEDTFDLDESAALPDLSSLQGVGSVSTTEHQVVASYFDTADLALAQAGIALRRRTGGEDPGWQLELPLDGAWLEIAVPLGRAVRLPPVALRRVVAGVVRDDGLAHIVTIHTDRCVHTLYDERGDALGEVALDRVSTEPASSDAPGLSPMTWHEARLDLLAGSASLRRRASDLLASSGARRSGRHSELTRAVGDRLPPVQPVELPEPSRKGPAADLIQLRLLRQVAVLRQLDAWVRHDAPESVHDMRVTVRRLRHALASYRPFLDRAQGDALRDDLAWLAGLLGGPRDAEVLQDVLRTLVDAEPATLVRGPVRARIDLDFAERFETSRSDLLSGMTSRRYFDLLDRLTAFAEEPPWTEAAHRAARRVLPKRLDADWRRLRARVRAAGEADGTEAVEGAPDLHDVRKAAKRVRYAAEALVPVFGKDAARMVRAHERIQTVLGEHHDDVEAQAALLQIADSATAAGENAFTYGVLHAQVQAEGSRHVEEFEQAWRDAVATRDRHRVG